MYYAKMKKETIEIERLYGNGSKLRKSRSNTNEDDGAYGLTRGSNEGRDSKSEVNKEEEAQE